MIDDDDNLPPFVPPSGYPTDPENVVPFVHPKAQQTRLVMPRYRLQYEGDPDAVPANGDLIKGVLPQVGVGFLGGATSTGKTYVVLDIAQSVQTGSDFAGYEVRKPGGVLIFAAEGSALIRPRWTAVKKAKVEPWLEQQGAKPGAMPLWWATEMPKLADVDAKEQLLLACNEVKLALIDKKHDCELVLVIIDTWAAMSNVVAAKETSETQKLMNMLQELSRLTGAFFLVVDHIGKDEARGLKDSSSKEQSADAVLMVLAQHSPTGVLSNTRVALRKVRGGVAGAELPFELVPTVIGIDDEDGKDISELVVNWHGVKQRNLGGRPNQREARFLEALTEALLERGVMTQPAPGYPTVKAVEHKLVREIFISKYPPAEDEKKRLNAANKAYKRAVDDLVARKQVVSLTVGRDVDARTLLWRVKEEANDERHTRGPAFD
jgi:hypothetical protein